MQGYTGPAALNEGIRAIGDIFSPETAINRQKAIMVKQQFEQTMKPITYDELAAKTSPDLWPSIQKMAEANGYAEEHNGVKFIRQGNLQEFHKQLGQNKVWQAQLLEESSKMNQAKLDQIKPQFEQATKQWEASIAIYKYKAQQELEKAKEEGRPPDVPLLTKLEQQIKEAQGKYPVYKQMTQLGQQMEQTMGAYKKRITSLGLLDEGFKKDVEKYGEPDAVKIALNPEYRRQLDLKIKQDDYHARYSEMAELEEVKARLKPEGNQTIEQLTARALKGDKEAAVILKKMQADKIAVAHASREPKDEESKKGKLTDVEKQRLDIIRDNITAIDKKLDNLPNTDKYTSQRATLEQQKKQLEVKRDKMVGNDTPPPKTNITQERKWAQEAITANPKNKATIIKNFKARTGQNF